MDNKKVTVTVLKDMKTAGEKISMLTCYDYLMASILDESGIDIILVGDSVGNVIIGYENTLPVTMDEMIHHCKAVTRGAKRALVIGDMPFMSYQVNPEEAVRNAGRFLKEANANAVKLEGGEEVLDCVKKIVGAGIPVMAHLGLTPQSIHSFGGYGLRGSSEKESQKIIRDAKLLEEAGAFAILLEKVPAKLGRAITENVSVPTIGIGAGPGCDGQVLVTHDMLGLFEKFTPKFSKKYAELAGEMRKAFKDYIGEVKEGKFPAEEHSY